jgi:hypothetical protein
MASSRRPTILRKLRIGELSLVDRPANPGAEVLLWKRDGEPPADPAVAAYRATFDKAAAAYRDLLAKGAGADAFDAALGAREAMEAVQAFNSAVWEVLDALGSAVCRISEDDGVADKAGAIKEAVDAALAALPAQVAEEAAEGDDVGKADAAAAKPADGRAAMGPAKRKLGAHLADLRDKLKGAKHAGHVAQALGGFYRHTAGVLASMPPSASPTDPPADGGVAKGAASPAALSIPAAGDGATARDGMTERQTGGAADTGTADAAELRKRLDEQATELAELKKRAGEADELRKRLEDTEAIAKAEREMRARGRVHQAGRGRAAEPRRRAGRQGPDAARHRRALAAPTRP